MVPSALIGLHNATDILEVEATHAAHHRQADDNSAKFELWGFNNLDRDGWMSRFIHLKTSILQYSDTVAETDYT